MQVCGRLSNGECPNNLGVGQGLRQRACADPTALVNTFFTTVLRVVEKEGEPLRGRRRANLEGGEVDCGEEGRRRRKRSGFGLCRTLTMWESYIDHQRRAGEDDGGDRLTTCSAFGLTISKAETEITCNQERWGKISFTITVTGQIYKQTIGFVD